MAIWKIKSDQQSKVEEDGTLLEPTKFHSMNVIDIGGGFPGDAANEHFPAMVKQINDFVNGDWCHQWIETRRKEVFQEYQLSFISEPGRFFAHQSSTLVTSVCGLKRCKDEERTTMNYYLNDGVYGSFNNLVFDHAVIKPPLHQLEFTNAPTNGNPVTANDLISYVASTLKPEAAEITKMPVFFSRFFGPTCDGFDVIMESDFPLLAEGECIVWSDMGAYTQAAASKFNGFSPPRKIYLPLTCEKNGHRSRGYI